MSTPERPTSVGAQTTDDRHGAVQEEEPEETPAQEEEAESPTGDELSLDVIFEILKNRRRRDVIHYLRTQDDRVPLGELAEHVAAIENDTTPEALTSSERKRVYVGLYQCHLPKMDDMGVVDFEQNRGFVSLADGAEALEPYIDQPEDGAEVPWYQYYGGTAGIGAGVLAMNVVGAISAPATLGLLVGVVGLFGLCSVTHWAIERRDDES